jgi:hypothetical protein
MKISGFQTINDFIDTRGERIEMGKEWKGKKNNLFKVLW